MEVRKLIIFAAVILGLSACSSKGERKLASEEVLFQNYVIATCLGTSFQETSVASDANKAANGYREFGNMPLEAYEESRSAVTKWLGKDYSSKSGTQVEIAKCIDLYRSEEVQKLYDKFSPCTTKDGWLDLADYQRQCK